MHTVISKLYELTASKIHFRFCLLLLACVSPVSAMFVQDQAYVMASVTTAVAGYAVMVIFFHGDYLERQCSLLENEVIKDPLTGAFNRRYLMDKLNDCLSVAKRTQDTASLVAIDIDFFKRVNDQYGHDVGDTVLKQVVRTVQARIRHSDRLCRIGGEEFILVLPSTDVIQAKVLADALRLQVSEAVFTHREEVTVSLGVSQLAKADSIDQWMKRSDQALYQAKAQGRIRVAVA